MHHLPRRGREREWPKGRDIPRRIRLTYVRDESFGNCNQYKVRLRFDIFHLLSYDQFFLFPRTLQFSRVFTIVPVKKILPMVNWLTGGQVNPGNYQP